MVRAMTMEAVQRTEQKVDRAFRGGAVSMGAGMSISTRPGYLPQVPSTDNSVLLHAASVAAPQLTAVEVAPDAHSGGSTDVGDVQHLMPVLVFRTGGYSGSTHAVDFAVVDEDLYYILTAKMFALSTYRLLKSGAAEARRMVDAYHPRLTKQQYIDYMEGMIRDEVLETVQAE